MKRAGNLWPAIIERGNLVRANQAARGKRRKLEVRRFERDLDANLERLRREIMDREVLYWLERILRGRRTAILAVSECGLPACTLQSQSSTAGKMPAFQDRLEARPPQPGGHGLPIGSLTSQHLAKRGVMEKVRSAAIELEPGEPGRQLEQQRQQLPHREPQQQQPDQQQQQRGLPPRPQLRPRVPERTPSMGLNRPPSRSRREMRRGKSTNRPSGAGRHGGHHAEGPGRDLWAGFIWQPRMNANGREWTRIIWEILPQQSARILRREWLFVLWS